MSSRFTWLHIQHLMQRASKPTLKQHLAAIRILFDWLATGEVIPLNPAHAVRGPKHSAKKSKTSVLSARGDAPVPQLHRYLEADRPPRTGDDCSWATTSPASARRDPVEGRRLLHPEALRSAELGRTTGSYPRFQPERSQIRDRREHRNRALLRNTREPHRSP